jgi:hypothetical protein
LATFAPKYEPEGDTTKRRGDTKDRCGRPGGETKNGCDHGRRDDADDDRDLTDGWKGTLLSDAMERTPVKRNRSARPTRIGGFAKGARRENQKSDDSRRR